MVSTANLNNDGCCPTTSFSFQTGWEIMGKVISTRKETSSCPEHTRQRYVEQRYCCSLRKGAQEKEKRSSWVAMSYVQREQLALAGFALQRYGNKNKSRKWTKIFENSLREKIGQLPLKQQGTALSSTPLWPCHYHGSQGRKRSQVQGSLAVPWPTEDSLSITQVPDCLNSSPVRDSSAAP